MQRLREWVHRLLSAVHRGRSDRDLEDELRLYVELAEEDAARRGVTPAEAGRIARVRAGGPTQTMDALRDQRGLRWFDDLVRDVTLGTRTLRRSPAFAVVALLTLALGIGANTAIFTIVSSVVLRPLSYPKPEQLVDFSTSTLELSQDEYLEVREVRAAFSDVGAYTMADVNLTAGERVLRVQAATVDGQLFSALGVQPAHGRLFAKGETDVAGPWFPGNPDNPQPPAIAILSHDVWQTAFGGQPMLGTMVEINRRRYEVIGIMPPDVGLMDTTIDVWLPLGLSPAQRYKFMGYHFLRVLGRLRDEVTIETARAHVDARLETFGTQAGDIAARHVSGGHIALTPMHDAIVGSATRSIWTLQAAVGLVLLIACVNLANLMLARAETRRRELAVRAALGASRGRLLRQFIAEGVLLSTAGGVLGLWLAHAGVDALVNAYPGSLPRSDHVTVDASVLFFTLAVSVGAGVLFGLAPIAHARTRNLVEVLKQTASRGSSGALRHHVRRGLVVAEVALAVTLVIGAGLLVRTAYNLMTVDPGFDPARLVTFSITSISPTRGHTYQRVLETLRAMPGVQAASAMSGLPPARLADGEETEFRNFINPESGPFAGVDYFQSVMSGYFETMGIPIVAGRSFQPADAMSSGMVAVINERLANTFWKDQNPIGQQLRPPWGDWVPMFTVIGVAKDVKQAGVDRETGTEFYFFVDQMARAPAPLGRAPITINMVLRTTLPPSALSSSVEQAVRSADRTVAVAQVREMSEVFAEAISRPRLLAQLVGAFAGLALLLAAIGTYGVLSYLVAERRQEIGIRLALGADRARVLGEIMQHGLTLTVVGLAIGLLGALTVSRLIAALLFGVDPIDMTTMTAVTALILVVATLACLLPAWRASRLDPNLVLRAD
jgi:predicted permease